MILDVKFEESNQVLPVKFSEVHEVSDGGYEKGYGDGCEVGEKEGYDKGFDKGLEQGYNDGYAKGSMPIYYVDKTMSNLWENAVFPENSEITLRFKKAPSYFYATFYDSVNLKTIKLISEDKSNTYDGTSIFRNIPQLEVVDLTEFNPKPKTINWGFLNDKKLKSILGAFDFSKCTGCTLWLAECNALEDISFVPNTIKISINFSYCSKLTDKSIQSIIDGLADLTGQTAQTLDFHADIVSKLTEEQWVQITDKNWSVL